VGPTGAGKTTLIYLLLRFYDPSSGSIRVNGRDLRQLPLAQTRNRMALVMQDPFLFSASIRDNIEIGASGLSDAQILSLADAAKCRDLVERLPQGIDTVLSEGGQSISSGERQLISIARAMARNPELILLDEATSYIDSETEARVQEALANLMEGRTTLLIAHRLSTARHADRILVLHRGAIIESGTHQDLIARKGFYYRLNQLQH
jgi:ATP-binding cassette subfamily B protein